METSLCLRPQMLDQHQTERKDLQIIDSLVCYSSQNKKWNLLFLDSCWRCDQSHSDRLHIWWDCPAIAPFWSKVRITHITETRIILSPACCILHIANCSMKRYRRSLTRHLLNAAKILIPRHWKAKHTPTITEWFRMVEEIYNMEETVAIARESTEKFL